MRIVFCGFQHETNTFAPARADYHAFELGGGFPPMSHGADVFNKLVPTANLPAAGFIVAAKAAGHDLVPTIWTSAVPSGRVTEDAFERIVGEIVDGIRAALPADAVYLDLHGAMVAERFDDGEGEILRRVRAATGPDMPIVASLDLHANVTEQMLREADALVAYRTYPHIDMADTGKRAFALIEKRIALGRRVALAIRRIPFLLPICWQSTRTEPAASLYEGLTTLESQSGLTSLSFTMGFPAADFAECGPLVWAYASDSATAEAGAAKMAQSVMDAEEAFRGPLYTPEEAIKAALELNTQGKAPIVIADAQDNPGAGGNSDTTGMLRALIALKVPKAALGLLWDPAAAAAAHEAGEGATVTLSLGGHSPVAGDEPLTLPFTVEKISDGSLHTSGAYYGKRPMSVGPSACLVHGGVRVVVASRKAQMADLEMFRFIGIEPTEQDILVVKSSIHFRAAFDLIAAETLTAIAPGPMAMRPTDWRWSHLPADIRMMPGGKTYGEVASTYGAEEVA